MWKPIILDVECIVCNKTLQKIKHDPREVLRKMGKITNRRSRTPNWSSEEKQCLLELIKEHKEVVVIKSNNGPNHSEEKDVAWNEILRQLAVKFGTKFTGFSIKKVKTQWQNMKRIAREEITLNGEAFQKYTKQSLEVCNILDLVKDGLLKKENENVNENNQSISTNIEIKTECMDEDIQLNCSSEGNYQENSQETNNVSNITNILESSSSLSSEPTETIEADNSEENQGHLNGKICPLAEYSVLENVANIIPYQKQIQEFIKQSTTERQLKIESLKEERQVVRAMRETAELNKIIAEQKLKHILWLKKTDMA